MKQSWVFFPSLQPRACALPSDRGRELGARGRLKANAVAYEKTSRQRQRGKTAGLPSHHKIIFWSGNFTPCRVVLPLETDENIPGQKQ